NGRARGARTRRGQASLQPERARAGARNQGLPDDSLPPPERQVCTMSTPLFRDQIVARLIEDLVGPLDPNEVLSDRPTQRYSTGILYPRDARIEPQEDEDGGLPVNVTEDAASEPEEAGVSLHAALKPATAGLSFALEASGSDVHPVIRIEVACAVYKRFAIDDAGNEVEGAPPDRAHERWRRMPLNALVDMELRPGETRIDLAEYGIEGLELYALVTPHAGLATVTVALANQRSRGDSSAFDEEQHFFQVDLQVAVVANGRVERLRSFIAMSRSTSWGTRAPHAPFWVPSKSRSSRSNGYQPSSCPGYLTVAIRSSMLSTSRTTSVVPWKPSGSLAHPRRTSSWGSSIS